MITNKLEVLESGTTYHVYNRANGNEKLFLSKENYRYFLQKFQEYICPVADVLCYCLMPNHFHAVIRLKSKREIIVFLSEAGRLNPTDLEYPSDLTLEKLISNQFGHFFLAYAKAFNKQYKRKGGLFIRPFKRKKVDSTTYLLNLIHYIHYNPVKSRICDNVIEWPHSSYNLILSDKESFIIKDEILELFDGRENFKFQHEGLSLEFVDEFFER